MTFGNLTIEQINWVGLSAIILLIGLTAQTFRIVLNGFQISWPVFGSEETEEEQALEPTNLWDEKQALLRVFVHDINTPLTNMNLFLDLLESHPSILEDEPQLIAWMRSNQQALLNTVATINDLEKYQADGVLCLNKETYDLAQSTELVVNAMKLSAARKQITLDYQISERPLVIFADRKQIERMQFNLISNAVKYTQSEGTVVVSAQIKDDVVITVEDNGYGIPAVDLPVIFDRFSRVNIHKDLAEGSGLGLAITKSIVEAHGGKIVVTSHSGLGTKFSVHLPLHDLSK